MPLDPDAQRSLDAMRKAGLPALETLTPDAARRQMKAARAALNQPKPEMAELRDFAVDGPHGPVALRLYRSRAAPVPSPVAVYFHGGGWVFGDLDTHDALCRHIADAGACTVIAVDYRLAPEHRFPAAIEDALAATRAVVEETAVPELDRGRWALVGDSAGASLAAVVALTLAGDKAAPRPAAQILIYPTVDLALETDSFRRVGEGYTLTASGMRWFRDHYLGADGDHADWRASPLRAPDLSGTPPALVITAGHDPLCDEGEHYAMALAKAGVPVTHRHFAGQMHGFAANVGLSPAADAALADIGAALQAAWRG